MESVYSSLFLSGGFLFWTSVLTGILIVLNVFSIKSKDLLGTSMILVVIVGAWHLYNKKNLNTFIQSNTCGKLVIDERLKCVAMTERTYVSVSVYEKDPEIRLEKFYRENEYEINRQVIFKINETCRFYSFCRYDYERVNSEFDLKKERIQNYLTQDLQKRIYFE